MFETLAKLTNGLQSAVSCYLKIGMPQTRDSLVLASICIVARASISRAGDAFHVNLPSNTFGFEKIDNSGNILGNLDCIVVVETEVISTD